MATITNFLSWVLYRVALPMLAISAALLHAYTVVSAFNLSPRGALSWAAAVAAWCTPIFAQLAVSYAAWRETGSRVNAYSSWLLAWIALLAAVMVLRWIVDWLQRKRAAHS
jgi:hypothetical protein